MKKIIRKEDKNMKKIMVIDEEKVFMTPYWKTKDNEQKIIYSDHCMMKTGINWKMMLQESKQALYAVEKEYKHERERSE